MIPPPTIFFFNDTATTEIYTLSLHDALPISSRQNLTQAMVYARGVVAGYAPIANMFGPEEFVPVAGKLGKAVSQHDHVGTVDGPHLVELGHTVVIMVERTVGNALRVGTRR